MVGLVGNGIIGVFSTIVFQKW